MLICLDLCVVKDVFDYFRGAMKANEKSSRVLQLTSDAIRLNAANYTVWQYRLGTRDIFLYSVVWMEGS